MKSHLQFFLFLLLGSTLVISSLIIFFKFNPIKRPVILTPTPIVTNQAKISEIDAINLVKKLPDVEKLIKKYPNYGISVEGSNTSASSWNVHVYEIVDDHTATYNWYYVDKNTGMITTEIFCGGIAGLPCPEGYTCKLSSTSPDAGGVCINSEP